MMLKNLLYHGPHIYTCWLLSSLKLKLLPGQISQNNNLRNKVNINLCDFLKSIVIDIYT